MVVKVSNYGRLTVKALVTWSVDQVQLFVISSYQSGLSSPKSAYIEVTLTNHPRNSRALPLEIFQNSNL